MILTGYQKRKVEDNIGLVGKVIKDKVHGRIYRMYGYEDLFQIGCIGLCKAAATDKGGHFSTYAYNLIWHEICDALRYAARREEMEHSTVKEVGHLESLEDSPFSEVETVIISIRKDATPSIRKGIDALLLMDCGYSLREIGERMGAAPNLVSAWVSKARKHLRKNEMLRAAGDG